MWPKSPTRTSANPPTSSKLAIAVVTIERRRLGASSRSCMAAIGGTRVERSAGFSAATKVTISPIRIEVTTVRLATTSAVVGTPNPRALNSASIPAAKAKPPKRPPTAPSKPIDPASTTTEPSIWRREAPSVRSIPNSRTRWATVIEKVLKITKAPTINAMAAKTPRKIGRKLSALWIWSDWRLAFCCAVSTRMSGGTTCLIRVASSAEETSGLLATEIWS